MMDRKTTYLDAISQAIHEEMARDEAVFWLGEDILPSKEALALSASLLEEFGAERVIDTPMSEAAMIGSAVGAALMGLRPITEMLLTSSVACDFTHVLHMASQMDWRTGMPMPIVVRGVLDRQSYHPLCSQQLTETCFSTAGMKVVAPSNTYDAKGMLKAAIRDNDPVFYLEQKWLHYLPDLREELPQEDYIVPLGKAIIRREGEDMTILTYGSLVYQCLKAAQVLEYDDGLEVEVMDLRSIVPLDRDAIIESVKRTNKVMLVHESLLSGSMGAEVSAILSEDLVEFLNGPITQVPATDLPLLHASFQEAAYLPHAEKILVAARALAAY